MSVIRQAVSLTGHEQLRHALQDMPLRVAKVGLRKAVNAGANPLLRAYRENLAAQKAGGDENATGLMKKAVKKKVRFYERSGSYVGIVGADRNVVGTRGGKKYVPANVAHLLETGAKAHVITPKTGSWKGRALKHPGFQKTQPLARAVESTRGQVQSAMSAKLAESVEEAAAKHAK